MFRPGRIDFSPDAETKKKTYRHYRRNTTDPNKCSTSLVEEMNRLSMRGKNPQNNCPAFSLGQESTFQQYTIPTLADVFADLESRTQTGGHRKNLRACRLRPTGEKWTSKENNSRLHNAFFPSIGGAQNECTGRSSEEVWMGGGEGKRFVMGQKPSQNPKRKRHRVKRNPTEAFIRRESTESEFTSFIAHAKREKSDLSEEFKKKGNLRMKEGDYQQAEAFYTEGLHQVQDECSFNQLASVLLTNRAAAKINQLNFSAALTDCMDAMERYPKNIRCYSRGATCQVSLGRFRQAQSLLERGTSMLSAEDARYRRLTCQMEETRKLQMDLLNLEESYKEKPHQDLLPITDYLLDKLCSCELVWKLRMLIFIEIEDFGEAWRLFDEYEAVMMSSLCASSDQSWWSWIRLQLCWWDHHQCLDKVIFLARDLRSRISDNLEISPFPAESLSKQELSSLIQLDEADNAKCRGNDLIKQKRYEEATEAYTRAIQISESVGSPLKTWAVFYCNRGAAFHGQGLYLNALRDVCIALALNPLYAKPYLRLGQIYLELSMPSSTCGVIKKMETHCHVRTQQETKQMDSLFMKGQDRESDERAPDAYKFMGIPMDSTTAEIKKVFKKLALKVHPDKAPHSVRLKLNWMKSGDRPIVERKVREVRDGLTGQMQYLFKQLNEMNGILLDRKARQELDEQLNPSRRYYYDTSTCFRQNWSNQF